MTCKRLAPVLALPIALCLAAPAVAEPDCSEGSYAADALVVPIPEIGDISAASQYAWDGGGRLISVCNLTTQGGDFFATWSLFSGEVDAVYPGICVSLTNAAGVEWYSCAAGDVVTAAFTAASETEEGIIRFETWVSEAPTLQ